MINIVNLYKFITIIIVIVILSQDTFGKITVPNYSFTGQEISIVKVKPSYISINFEFKMPSRMNIYLEKREAEFIASDKKDYKSDEPGFIYSSQSGASFSSVFVGNIAYRNNIVKSFLQGSYLDVISSFDKFEKKLKKTELYNECQLLYGLSLYKTGNHKASFDILSSLALKDDEYAELAQDNLFQNFLDNIRRYPQLEDTALNINKFSPYSLSLWLNYLNSKSRYEDILQILNKNENVEKQYPSLLDIKVYALYFTGKYKEIEKYSNNLSPNSVVYPIIIDALIMNNNFAKLSNLINQLDDQELKLLLNAKLDIAKNNYPKAISRIKDIQSDNEKLSLLFYALTNNYKDVTPEFISSFSFKDKKNNDYTNFYLGLKYFDRKKYLESANSFSKVAFNKDMVILGYFYQGMASAYVDPSRAEWNFLRYINDGNDQEKIQLSKFMLSQLYMMKDKFNEALILVDDCRADYCIRLKGEIFLLLKDYNKSLAIIKELKDKRSLLIKATNYYNLKDYEKAISKLKKINKLDNDGNYILMMCYFKMDKVKDAEKILKSNMNNPQIVSAAIEQLTLIGESKKALKYIESIKERTPNFELERGKLLLSFGRLKEAETIFRTLRKKNFYQYESTQGLLQIAQKNNTVDKFINDSIVYVENTSDFNNKDRLITQFAEYGLELKNPATTIRYVNYFMDNYKESLYLSDMYTIRAKLFQFTKRYENCISDADKAVMLTSKDNNAYFLKAECTEHVDKAKAVNLYREMALDNGRFKQPANSKLIMLSDSPEELLASAEKMKSISPKIYKDGVIRFLELSDKNIFNKYEEAINRFASPASSENVRSVAYWRIGNDLIDKKEYEDATVSFLKGYYLFPNEDYAVKNLIGAKDSYIKRGMNEQAAKLSKMIEKYNVKSNTSSKKNRKK